MCFKKVLSSRTKTHSRKQRLNPVGLSVSQPPAVHRVFATKQTQRVAGKYGSCSRINLGDVESSLDLHESNVFLEVWNPHIAGV